MFPMAEAAVAADYRSQVKQHLSECGPEFPARQPPDHLIETSDVNSSESIALLPRAAATNCSSLNSSPSRQRGGGGQGEEGHFIKVSGNTRY